MLVARLHPAWLGVLLALVVACGDSVRLGTPAPPCSGRELEGEVAASGRNAIDVLFVIDNGPSMAGERAHVDREVGRMIELLTKRTRSDGDPAFFTPLEGDLQIGVVSADLGALGDAQPGCSALGDGAALQGGGPSCAGDRSPFVWSYSGFHDPAQVLEAARCRARLDESTCGFSQPLEAALVALLPSELAEDDPLAAIELLPPRRALGDADNAGFLREFEASGGRVYRSGLHVVVITDKDDCSSPDPMVFAPDDQLPPGSPLRGRSPEERCALHPQLGYPLERYALGLRALFPGNQQLVSMSIIAGIPPDLAPDDNTRDRLSDSLAAAGAFYERVLADPRMQSTFTPEASEPGVRIASSCTRDGAAAYPPRRLVALARELGVASQVFSICDDDWRSAIAPLFAFVGHNRFSGVCIPGYPTPDADGLTGCRVFWALPPADPTRPATPSRCDERPFLSDAPNAQVDGADPGGVVCELDQVPVVAIDDARVPQPGASGFFVDEGEEAAKNCWPRTQRWLRFTDDTQPPAAVVVRVQCADPVVHQVLDQPGVAMQPPPLTIGDRCDGWDGTGTAAVGGDDACARVVFAPAEAAAVDRRLFCHPQQLVCTLGCADDADCPDGWFCDAESDLAASAGRALCVNPSC